MASRARKPWARISGRWPQVALGLVLAGALYQALCHSEAFVDDAAITFAYSQQLAETGELVHTASSERVEGFSNPTWTFLCAIAFLLSMDPYMFARALGLLALGATVLLVYRTCLHLAPRAQGAALTAAFFTAMAPCVPFWVMGGLETPLVALLLAATVWQVLLEEDGLSRPRSGLLLAALALSRPEGIMYAAPVALFKALKSWRRGERSPGALLRRHWVPLVQLLVPVAGFLLWRRLYFDTWLPNTYDAKLNALELMQPDVVNLNRGQYYVAGFLEVYHLWPVVYAAPLALALRRRWAESLLVIAAAALHVGFVLWVDGDWMGDFRFFAMVMPLWGLGLAVVFRGGGDLIARSAGWLAARRGATSPAWPEHLGRLAVAAAALAFLFFGFLPTLRDYSRMGWVRMELVRYQGTGLEMVARRAGLSRASIAIPDVGGSALTANVHVVDTVGLTDRVYAAAKGRPDWLRRYFFEEVQPDLFQEHSHWKRYYNYPRHFELANDYVMLPQEHSKRMLLLGENYLRREHLTGWPREHDHLVGEDVVEGLSIVAYDDAIDTSSGQLLRLLVAVEPHLVERLPEIGVELRAPDGAVRRAGLGDVTTLPAELFRPGFRLRLRLLEPPGSVDAFRVIGPGGVASRWLDAAPRDRGPQSGDLARYVLHPRSLFACGPAPSRWSHTLGAAGRLQLFDSCRAVVGRRDSRRLAGRLRDRARRFLEAGEPEPAIRLLERAETLRPRSWAIRSESRSAARAAYRLARGAAAAGDLARARSLSVAAIGADPLLPRARSLYLSLMDRGLSYSPDARARALAATERLRRHGADERAVVEALEALLAAERPLEAARLAYELPASAFGPRAAVPAAQAFLAVGLCEEAAGMLPARPTSCSAAILAHRARHGCGEPTEPPTCSPSEPDRRPEPRVILDFDDGAATLAEAEPLEQPDNESYYVSGSVGPDLVRTDWAVGGVDAHWSGETAPFRIAEPALSLQVGGGTAEDRVEVVLVVDGEEVRRASGQGDPHLRRVTWDVSPWRGRSATLRIRDRGDSDWGFILVDHVRGHAAHLFDPNATP